MIRPTRIIVVDSDPVSICALAMFLSDIEQCSFDVVYGEDQVQRHLNESPSVDLLLFSHDTDGESQEMFSKIRNHWPDVHAIVLLPEPDLDLEREYREGGTHAVVYRVENYLAHLRQAIRKAFVSFWGNEAVSSGYLQSFEPGKQLAQYNILKLLGSGLRTDVFKAEDEKGGRTVALKILPPAIANHNVVRRRLIREALAASQLKHPFIVSVYEIVEHNGISFLVMENLEGESLASILRRGSIGMFHLLEVGAQISEALHVSHLAGRIHGNIKPGNILLTSDGQAKLLDFGHPHRITTPISTQRIQGLIDLGKSGVPWDSFLYLSPEQTRGENPEIRSDLFSFGALFYFAATGVQPFEADDAFQTIERIQKEDPQKPSHHKAHLEELDTILLSALAKESSSRLSSASELQTVLTSLKSKYVRKEVEKFDKSEDEEEFEEPPKRRNWVAIGFAVAVLIGIIAAAWYFMVPRKNRPVPFAVLAIQFPAAESDLSDLSTGITDSLIDAFSLLPQLQVIQPVTVFQYGVNEDPRTVAEQCNVRYYVTGRIQVHDQNRQLLEIQLVSREKGVLWSGQYSVGLQSLHSIRFDIFREITTALSIPVDQGRAAFLNAPAMLKTEAIREYLHGRSLYYKQSNEDLISSIQNFDRAIQMDPGYAAAFSARSLSYLDLAAATSDPADYERALHSATRALELQEKLTEAHTVLGALGLFYQRDFKIAEEELRRSIVLNPNSSRSHLYMATLLAARQQEQAALDELQQAADRDPASPFVHRTYARILTKMRKYDEAIQYLYLHSNHLHPVEMNLLLGDAYSGKKAFKEALQAYRRSQDLESNDAQVRIATVMATDGMQRESSMLLENLIAQSRGEVDQQLVAAAYAQLGNRSKTMEWLHKSLEIHSPNLVFLKIDPDFDPVRSDPEFQRLLKMLE